MTNTAFVMAARPPTELYWAEGGTIDRRGTPRPWRASIALTWSPKRGSILPERAELPEVDLAIIETYPDLRIRHFFRKEVEAL